MTNLIVYGIIADVIVIVPILAYLFVPDLNNFASHHEEMIALSTATWGPLAISWPHIFVNDTEDTRKYIKASVFLAGFGPLSYQWVGLVAFIMSVFDSNGFTYTLNIIFACVYGLLNISMVALHMHISPDILSYLEFAPYSFTT